MDPAPGLREFTEEVAARLVLFDEPGPEVKRLRERYGFTQEVLAGLLSLTRESLSRIESGHVSPTRPFIQRFTRIMALAKGAREHLAYMEARDAFPDERHLTQLAAGLRIEKQAAEEVILAASMSYEAKRRETLRGLGSRSRRPAAPGGLRARPVPPEAPRLPIQGELP
ncbi:MAG TPA: helix-turn-helix domain-containing protein [Candidatus Thermoplasmatota archaeon]|nr:helix-turn-helix domain-containing protein [Candidatus Thermoplasmatota archaeon]